ncbi:MAG: hypothetical protein AB7S89_03530 [Candidatus Babeliales bacterium]
MIISRNRFNKYLLFTTLLFSGNASFAQTAWSLVEQEFLKTITPSQEAHKVTDVTDLEDKTKKGTFSPSVLNEYDQHAIALSLFKNLGSQSEPTVIDTKFIKKMELLCGGSSAGQHLLSHIDRTQSLFGKLALANMLISPTRSQETIEERQAFVKGILTLDTDELDTLFGSLRTLETDALSFWRQENEATQKMFDRLYFGDYFGFLNKSTVALECKTRLRNAGTFFMMSLPFLPEIGTTIIQKGKQTRPADIANALARYGKSFYPFPLAFKDKSSAEVTALIKDGNEGESFGDICIGIDTRFENAVQWNKDFTQRKIDYYRELQAIDGEDFTADAQDELNKLLKNQAELSTINVQAKTKPLKIVIGAGKVFITALTLWQIKKAINEAQLNTTTTNYLHKTLISLTAYIDTIKKAHGLLKNVEGAQNIKAFDVLASYFDGSAQISDKAKELMAMLNSSTFRGEPSFFTITGRVLAAHKLMKEVKNEFAPFFAAAGELEAYYGIAKLYAEHQSTKARYCFVQFDHSDKPYIAADGFWNPFIDANKVVTNDIVLNNYAEQHNVILTGPNTGGKSTVIKAVAINLLLAQTFGIAAADSFTFTPFAAINCYLNITDDIASGTSLFHAEILRAKELVEQIKTLRSDEFCFTIMDEVFSGTNAEGGSEYAYKFADELGRNENTILVIATHFGNMHELETTSNFKNLSVTAHVMDNGTIIRPYKLENGPFSDPENKVLKALLEQEGIFA